MALIAALQITLRAANFKDTTLKVSLRNFISRKRSMSDPIWKRGGWYYERKIVLKGNKKSSCPNVEAEHGVRLRNRTKED